MNIARLSVNPWTTSLWIALTLILAFFAVGAAVNVPWGNASIPVREVFDSIDWRQALRFYDNDGFAVFAVAASLTLVYTVRSSWKLRLVSMLAGLLLPLVLIDPEIATAMMFAPLAAFWALSGRANGEFYVEDIPQAAAMGLWMLLCLVFLMHELHQARMEAKRTSAKPTTAVNTALPGHFV